MIEKIEKTANQTEESGKPAVVSSSSGLNLNNRTESNDSDDAMIFMNGGCGNGGNERLVLYPNESHQLVDPNSTNNSNTTANTDQEALRNDHENENNNHQAKLTTDSDNNMACKIELIVLYVVFLYKKTILGITWIVLCII